MKTSIWSVVGDDDLPQAVSEAVSESPSFRESSRRVISIHIDHLEPDPNQPRKYIPQHVIKLRREQMLAQGQLTPITVYPLDENDHYIILDGECRWRAAVSARNDGLKELNYLQAVIDEGNPEDGYTRLIKQLMHNDDGSEPLTIIEKAVAYKTLMD